MTNFPRITGNWLLATTAFGLVVFLIGFFVGRLTVPVNEEMGSLQKSTTSVVVTDTRWSSSSTEEFSVTGTYESFTQTKDQLGTFTCDTFIVREGNPEAIAYYKNKVEAGNTVQSITPEGYLRINLPWQEIPDDVQARLKSGATTTLNFIKEAEQPKGAQPCHSFQSYGGVAAE